MRLSINVLLAFLGFVLCSNYAWADRRFVNESGKPFSLLALRDSNGKVFARLFMSGKEMVLDDDGNPISGAGYYQAEPANYHFVSSSRKKPILFEGDLCALRVDKIEWDEKGRTIAITGLRPFLEQEKNLAITSDTKKLKIVDGILYLRFKGRDTEFKIDFAYGKIIGITASVPTK